MCCADARQSGLELRQDRTARRPSAPSLYPVQQRAKGAGEKAMNKIVLLTVGLLLSTAAVRAETVLVDMKGPGSGNPFWAAVEAGAKERAKELNVDVIVLAPPAESDIQSQISQIEDQLTKKIDAMALAPTDPNALKPVVEEARKQGVGVVFID